MPVIHCSCGHEWSTRKPLDSIEQLRCSKCNTTSEDDLTVTSEGSAETASDDGTLLSKVKAASKRKDLIEHVGFLLERLEGTGLHDDDGQVAQEVRGEYQRLQELLATLEEHETISLKELTPLQQYTDELEERINEYADDLDRIDELQYVVSDLEVDKQLLSEERDKLHEQVKRLDKRKDHLKFQKMELENAIGELEAVKNTYQRGYFDGRDDGAVWVPCNQCGGKLPIEPGSIHHQELISNYQFQHPSCGSPPSDPIRMG